MFVTVRCLQDVGLCFRKSKKMVELREKDVIAVGT